jgi:hypothetical protein
VFIEQNERAAALGAFEQFHDVSKQIVAKSPSDRALLTLFDLGIAALASSIAAEARTAKPVQAAR